MTPPRRLAWAASVVSVSLATLPAIPIPGRSGSLEYDPALAVLTATLIAVLWYTCFTYESLSHLRTAARETRSQTRTALYARAKRLIDTLADLPTEQQTLATMVHVSLWEAHDVREFEGLGALLGPEVARDAAEAAKALGGIREQVEAVKREHLQGTGVRWNKFRFDTWKERLEGARAALERVAAAAR